VTEKPVQSRDFLRSRRVCAFLFTCERLFSERPKVYFWTFTFKNVPYCDTAAMEDWDTFAKRLLKHFPDVQGVRVSELHKSHGIHFHVLLDRRIPVDRMIKMWRGSGKLTGHNRYLDFGRWSVSVCSLETAGYLAKYLTKSYADRFSFGHRRRWGCVGGYKPTRVRDLEIVNDATKNRDLLFGGKKCTWVQMIIIRHYSALWGHLRFWPSQYRAAVDSRYQSYGSLLMRNRAKFEPF